MVCFQEKKENMQVRSRIQVSLFRKVSVADARMKQKEDEEEERRAIKDEARSCGREEEWERERYYKLMMSGRRIGRFCSRAVSFFFAPVLLFYACAAVNPTSGCVGSPEARVIKLRRCLFYNRDGAPRPSIYSGSSSFNRYGLGCGGPFLFLVRLYICAYARSRRFILAVVKKKRERQIAPVPQLFLFPLLNLFGALQEE